MLLINSVIAAQLSGQCFYHDQDQNRLRQSTLISNEEHAVLRTNQNLQEQAHYWSGTSRTAASQLVSACLQTRTAGSRYVLVLETCRTLCTITKPQPSKHQT